MITISLFRYCNDGRKETDIRFTKITKLQRKKTEIYWIE